ncbi:MAG: hypothetical protein HXX81_08035 [Campylobacterales bacterium]|nr:hypothetical protein [Campylobacterales bacterium]
MNSKIQGAEPSLKDMDDYDFNESSEKKKLINFVIIIGLVIGLVYATFKFTFNHVDDELPNVQTQIKNY